MWNETAMHHHQEDGRSQFSAWSLPLILFAFVVAGSFFAGGAEPADLASRLPAQIASADVAR